MTCENCLHFDVCRDYYNEMPTDCEKMDFLTTECNGHYKDKSRFVELPCKYGDKFYLAYDFGVIEERECCGFSVDDNGAITLIDEVDNRYELESTFSRDFYKIFLTREEAEKALKERENNA